MKPRGSSLLMGVLAVALVGWLIAGRGGEEQRLRGQLDRLGELIEKEKGEGKVTTVSKARQLGELFADRFTLDLDAYGQVSDRAQLSRLAAGYRGRYPRIGVDFRDIEIVLDPAERQADMVAVAVLRGEALSRESYRLRWRWVKQGGEWRIAAVELLEILEGPAGYF